MLNAVPSGNRIWCVKIFPLRVQERIIEGLLWLSAVITILITADIIRFLFSESVRFFSEVSIVDFLTDDEWTPLFAEKHFGIMPLVAGTLLTTAIAIAVALPIGLTIAVYLNEYAPARFKQTVKPLLEILAT